MLVTRLEYSAILRQTSSSEICNGFQIRKDASRNAFRVFGHVPTPLCHVFMFCIVRTIRTTGHMFNDSVRQELQYLTVINRRMTGKAYLRGLFDSKTTVL